MRLEPAEIDAIAEALAPKVAAILIRHLDETPQWAQSIPEAAAWAKVPEDAIRHAIKTGKLPVLKVGHNVRIRRCDLFGLNGQKAEVDDTSTEAPARRSPDRPAGEGFADGEKARSHPNETTVDRPASTRPTPDSRLSH